jgi:hypothetical protein
MMMNIISNWGSSNETHSLVRSQDDVKYSVKQWFHQQPKAFFEKGILRLVIQYDACLNAQEYYF